MSFDFATLYKTLPTEQLIRIVHIDHTAYCGAALDCARAELATRNDQPTAQDLPVALASLRRGIAKRHYFLTDQGLRLIPLFVPPMGFWIAIFQWVAGRPERARIAWTWWFFGVLFYFGLVLTAHILYAV